MDLLHTLLELGHSTSANLGFAYDLSPSIGFGEETITESNLLEIRRRHPHLTRIQTFSKYVESSQTGADWEWHLIGRVSTLKLRVQAKRVTKNGSIKGIFQKAKTAHKPQVDLLLESATRDGVCPVYCFYCAERHRDIWTASSSGGVAKTLETGCLLSPASTVKSIAPTQLSEVEAFSRPWHFLWAQKAYSVQKNMYGLRYQEETPTERYLEEIEIRNLHTKDRASGEWALPMIRDLNREDQDLSDFSGIFQTEPDQLSATLSFEYFEEREINLVVMLDVGQPDMLLRMSR